MQGFFFFNQQREVYFNIYRILLYHLKLSYLGKMHNAITVNNTPKEILLHKLSIFNTVHVLN